MTGFICHDDYYDRLARLTDEEVGHLFRQLMLYHAGRKDEMSDFIGIEGLAFDFIASDIDRTEENYKERCETNRLNGSKGGRPKTNQKPNGYNENQTVIQKTETNQTKANESEQNQTKPYKDKDKYKEKEKDKDKDILNNLFAQFWAAYPRHEAKQTALKAFEKLKPDDEILQIMIAAIEKQKQSSQWKENGGQFIPHPSTWLNQRRWEDEPQQATFQKPQNVQQGSPSQQYEQRSYDGAQDDAMQLMLKRFREEGIA